MVSMRGVSVLREEDIREDIGRGEDSARGIAGTFIRITHVPTGISRTRAPLADDSAHAIRVRFPTEIEEELISKGLTEHIVPAYRTPRTLKNRQA